MKYKLSYAETPFEIKYWKYGCPELLKECIKEYIIKMNFVTYEIGKKLKEKGYPHGYNRFGYRPIYSDDGTIKYITNAGAHEQEHHGENIPVPTIDEVLKWLRKEKRIHITVPAISDDDYWWMVNDFKKKHSKYDVDKFDSYELAALAGIAYALDNLI